MREGGNQLDGRAFRFFGCSISQISGSPAAGANAGLHYLHCESAVTRLPRARPRAKLTTTAQAVATGALNLEFVKGQMDTMTR
jgi:hypothetical protein